MIVLDNYLELQHYYAKFELTRDTIIDANQAKMLLSVLKMAAATVLTNGDFWKIPVPISVLSIEGKAAS